MSISRLILVTFIILSTAVFGQNERLNTLTYSDTTGSPKADLSNIQWIEGHWKGEALGGITEEVWTPPLGGSMMCAFKLVVNSKVKFYELLTIAEEDNSLILKLKHFHSDLKGWEEINETIDFKLVKVTENKVYFDGFTFEQLTDNEMNIYVVFMNEGEKSEMKFNYKKVN